MGTITCLTYWKITRMRKQLGGGKQLNLNSIPTVGQLDSRLDAIIIRLRGVVDGGLQDGRGSEEGHRTEGEGEK